MAGDTAAESVRRVRRPSWRDPRLGLGLLLVTSSVLLGAWAVGSADDTVPYYAARTVLTPGRTLTEADLTVVRARIPDGSGEYLSGAAPVPTGTVVTRTVGSGELVPSGALGRAGDVDVRPVTVGVQGPLSRSVVDGALVDLWLAPEPVRAGGTSEAREPVLVASGLRVAGVRADESLFAGVASTAVEVLVPQAGLSVVLAALAQEGDVVLVPIPGGP